MTNIEVKQIELNGTKYWCDLNMLALEEFLIDVKGTTLDDVEQYLGGAGMRKVAELLHFMLEYGHRLKGEPFSMSKDELWVAIAFDVDVMVNHIYRCFPDIGNFEKKMKNKAARPTKAKAAP